MKRLIAILISCLPLLAHGQATTEYLCDCQTGAHASCVPGSSGNNGTSASTPKQTLAQLAVQPNSKPAGSRIRYCEGGAWNTPTLILENMNATAASRLTFDSYAPPSGATGKPIWRSTGGDGVVFGTFIEDPVTADKGYVFRNIRFYANGSSGTGFFVWNTVSHVLWDTVTIDGWGGNGIEMSEPTGRDYIIRNSIISGAGTNGFLGCGDELVIEGTTFENNNTDGGTQEHAIYLAASGHECKRVTLRDNALINNSTVAGTCNGGNLTAHGKYDQLVVERNLIVVPAATDNCYGISLTSGYDVSEYFRRTTVSGNTIVNVGNVHITVHSAPGVLIENNRIIGTNARYFSGISLVEAQVPPDDANVNGILRNNTCWYSQAASGSSCIQLGTTSGTNLKVTNNQAYYGASSSSGAVCWVHPALSRFNVWNYNGCYFAGSGSWSSTYSTLANAQAAGFDANGINSNPNFAATPSSGNNWSLALTGTSPGRYAGSNANKALFDVIRCKRSATPSIGAHEYEPLSCLSIKAPVAVR